MSTTDNTINLKDVVILHNNLEKYKDNLYIGMIRQVNSDAQEIFHSTENPGSIFVKNCARDLAGEVVRQFFDTSDFYLTVDQLAMRILHFDYENEYDPLGSNHQMVKNVLNQSEFHSGTLDKINTDMMNSQQKLFNKTDGVYDDQNLMTNGKRNYANSKTDENGNITDEYTGQKGEYVTDKNGNKIRRQEVDHVQSAAAASYNSKYIKESGIEELKNVLNSEDNFAMMDKTANQSKGDVRVYDSNGNDITYKATPKQMTDAVCERWENITNEETVKKLKEKGYLNEDGKVPESIKKKLYDNYVRSQNAESKVILKNTDYTKVAKDAAGYAISSIGRIIAGQLIYYSAPAIVYEIRLMLSNKSNKLDYVLNNLKNAFKRVGDYVLSHLKDIVNNVIFNSMKNFVKAFFDILINLVKATVQKLLKIAKRLAMSTADALRIVVDKNRSAAEKADAVFTLYGVTVTNIVIDVIFELIHQYVHLPQWLLNVFQILTSVVCTNLIMLILEKLDLFDVRFGFKITQVQKIFEEARENYLNECNEISNATYEKIEEMLQQAKSECLNLYNDIISLDPHTESVRNDLEGFGKLFNLEIDYQKNWLDFLGIAT